MWKCHAIMNKNKYEKIYEENKLLGQIYLSDMNDIPKRCHLLSPTLLPMVQFGGDMTWVFLFFLNLWRPWLKNIFFSMQSMQNCSSRWQQAVLYMKVTENQTLVENMYLSRTPACEFKMPHILNSWVPSVTLKLGNESSSKCPADWTIYCLCVIHQ